MEHKVWEDKDHEMMMSSAHSTRLFNMPEED